MFVEKVYEGLGRSQSADTRILYREVLVWEGAITKTALLVTTHLSILSFRLLWEDVYLAVTPGETVREYSQTNSTNWTILVNPIYARPAPSWDTRAVTQYTLAQPVCR